MGRENCVVCGLTLKQTFCFPKDKYHDWAKLTKVSREKLRKYKLRSLKLCIDHFRPEDFYVTPSLTRLKKGIVPTKCLPPSDSPEKENYYLFEDLPRPTIYDTEFGDISPRTKTPQTHTDSSKKGNDCLFEELPRPAIYDTTVFEYISPRRKSPQPGAESAKRKNEKCAKNIVENNFDSNKPFIELVENAISAEKEMEVIEGYIQNIFGDLPKEAEQTLGNVENYSLILDELDSLGKDINST